MNVLTPNRPGPGVEILYAPVGDIFKVAGPAMAARGWSVWPQERDGARMPGRVLLEAYGDPKPFKWGALKERLPNASEMAAFVRDCGDLNVACAFGPAQAHTFAIDVDCLDPDVSARVEALAVEHLGATPLRRIGRAPKVALIYRASGPSEVPASTSKRFQGRDDCAVEILSAGKPLTLHGFHHKTGRYFVWPDQSPLVVGPEAAPAVTRAQVTAFLGAVEREFPFEAPAGGVAGGESVTDWTVRTDGLWTPRANGPDAGQAMDGKATDGREAYLHSLVWKTVTANGTKLLAADAAGQGEAVQSALKKLVLEAFEQSAECSGRWAGERLRGEVERRVGALAAKMLAGNVKPWTPRERCRVAPGQVSENSGKGEAAMDAATESKVAPKHEPEVVAAVLKDAASKPHIALVPGQMPAAVDAAERALVLMGGVYERGGFVVRAGNVRVTTSDGPQTSRALVELGEYGLLEQLSKAASFFKFDARKGENVPADPPKDLAHMLKERRGDMTLPTIAGIVSAPTMRADGSILDKPGYDPASGLLYEPAGEIPEVDYAAPPKTYAEQCLGYLESLIEDFPFVSPADKSVALSAFLTACVRRSLPSAPMHAFSATTAGSGKTKLADICGVLATGGKAAVLSLGKSEEETEKRIGASLLEGAPVLLIDNVTGGVGGDFLCSVLTQETVRTRILGKSEVPTLSANVFITAGGNNLAIVGDMTRRVMLCRLDPGCERPEERQDFEFEPVTEAMANRQSYVAACLVVLRAYVVAGMPGKPRPLGSFEKWSDLVRGALLWLGRADPKESVEAVRETDPHLEAVTNVLSQWHAALGTKKVSGREVIETATEHKLSPNGFATKEFEHPDFREALLTVAAEAGFVNSRKLGKYLAANAGRVVSGLRLVKVGTTDGSATWRVEKV